LIMSPALSHLAHEARLLPGPERFSLALMLLDDDGATGTSTQAWEEEIQARIRAIDAGAVKGIPYDEAMAELDRRLGQ
jgi:putative addiction module component (TIGR02574 family)